MSRAGNSSVYSFLQRPSLVDFPGRLAAVFFLSGCNFRCRFCHNSELVLLRDSGISWKRLEEVCRRFNDNWVGAGVITGGEPLLSGGVGDLLDYFGSLGWVVKLDTNGSRPVELDGYMDRLAYVAMDIKAGLSGYGGIAGWEDTDAVRESIRLIMERAVDYEFRTTVIESFHTDEQMKEIGELINGAKRYVLQAFVPRDTVLDPELRQAKRTSPDRLQRIAAMMKEYAGEVIVRGE